MPELEVQQYLILGAAAFLFLLFWWLSRPKYFYLVRHGQTLLNKQHLKQGAEGALSPEGILQAEAVAKALAPLKVRHIFSSPFERAVQTAAVIAEECKAPVTQTPLLAERRSPSEVIGKPVRDPEVMRITGLTEYGYHPDSFRFSDEENFEDLRARAKTCLRYLAFRGSRTNVVVTHHVFLQMLTAYLLYRDNLSASDYVKLAFFNPVENGGVTIYSYSPLHLPFSKTRGWQVHGYNELVITEENK
jgi:broad specificity phosphatase PhoE